MRKIVYNDCYGGFELSPLAQSMLYTAKTGKKGIFYREEYTSGFNALRYTKVTDLENIGSHHSVMLEKDLGDVFQIPSGWEEQQNSEAYKRFRNAFPTDDVDYERHDKDLVRIVELLGEKASGDCANLQICEIEDDDKYIIREYDGCERVETLSSVKHWGWR